MNMNEKVLWLTVAVVFGIWMVVSGIKHYKASKDMAKGDKILGFVIMPVFIVGVVIVIGWAKH